MRRRNSTRQGHQPITARWIVEYGGLAVECRDETDAKNLVVRLHKKGLRVSARTYPGVVPQRSVSVGQIKHWLANRTNPPRSSKAVAPPSD